MNKQLRILGKRGRITIPYAIRKRVGFAYNDVLSFTEQDNRTVVVRRERLCDNCAGREPAGLADTMELEGFLDALPAEQQKAALVHLSVKLTGRQGGKHG